MPHTGADWFTAGNVKEPVALDSERVGRFDINEIGARRDELLAPPSHACARITTETQVTAAAERSR